MQSAEFMARIGSALLLGAGIGLERQWRQRLAGLRTNALVAVGAALFVSLSAMTPHESSATRVAGQVVSGIGFLGAGVIMRDGLNVRGLNTAATLWCAAAVGALCGTGFRLEASLGACMILAANLCLRPLAQKINRQPTNQEEEEAAYLIRAVCRSKHEAKTRTAILQFVNDKPVTLTSLHSVGIDDQSRAEVHAELLCTGQCSALLEQMVARLSLEAGINAVSGSGSQVYIQIPKFPFGAQRVAQRFI